MFSTFHLHFKPITNRLTNCWWKWSSDASPHRPVGEPLGCQEYNGAYISALSQRINNCSHMKGIWGWGRPNTRHVSSQSLPSIKKWWITAGTWQTKWIARLREVLIEQQVAERQPELKIRSFHYVAYWQMHSNCDSPHNYCAFVLHCFPPSPTQQ